MVFDWVVGRMSWERVLKKMDMLLKVCVWGMGECWYICLVLFWVVLYYFLVGNMLSFLDWIFFIKKCCLKCIVFLINIGCRYCIWWLVIFNFMVFKIFSKFFIFFISLVGLLLWFLLLSFWYILFIYLLCIGV